MRNVLKKDTFRTFKTHSLIESRTSYKDYHNEIIRQSLCLGCPVTFRSYEDLFRFFDHISTIFDHLLSSQGTLSLTWQNTILQEMSFLSTFAEQSAS